MKLEKRTIRIFLGLLIIGITTFLVADRLNSKPKYPFIDDTWPGAEIYENSIEANCSEVSFEILSWEYLNDTKGNGSLKVRFRNPSENEMMLASYFFQYFDLEEKQYYEELEEVDWDNAILGQGISYSHWQDKEIPNHIGGNSESTLLFPVGGWGEFSKLMVIPVLNISHYPYFSSESGLLFCGKKFKKIEGPNKIR